MRTALALSICATLAYAAARPDRLDLVGEVTGAGRTILSVTLFGVDHPFTTSTETDFLGEFRFHALSPGTYTVSVLKNSLGATRRTVVSPSLADQKGAVRVTIPFDPAAAAGVSGGTISKNSLSIPGRARRKYSESQKQLAKQDVEGATRSLHAALDLAPQFTQAWNALGMIAYQTHDLPEAERDFRTAIAVEPAAFEPNVNLGGVLLSEGKFAAALEVNQRALAQRPADALANVQAGIAFFALGDYDRAEPALLQALHADPAQFSKPQLFLADIYLRRGDAKAALAAIEDYVARHPDADDVERQRQRIRQLQKILVP